MVDFLGKLSYNNNAKKQQMYKFIHYSQGGHGLERAKF